MTEDGVSGGAACHHGMRADAPAETSSAANCEAALEPQLSFASGNSLSFWVFFYIEA